MNSATIKSYFEVLIKISTFLPSNQIRLGFYYRTLKENDIGRTGHALGRGFDVKLLITLAPLVGEVCAGSIEYGLKTYSQTTVRGAQTRIDGVLLGLY